MKGGFIGWSVVAVLVNGLLVSTSWVTVPPLSVGFGFGLFAMLLIAAALALAVTVISLVGLSFNATRKAARWALAHSAVWVASFVVLFPCGIWVGNYSRESAFREIAAKSSPIVNAIEVFGQKNGRFPGKLEDLVPEFLAQIPTEAIGALYKYEYITGKEAENQYDRNPWVLKVEFVVDVFDQYVLIYRPKTIMGI